MARLENKCTAEPSRQRVCAYYPPYTYMKVRSAKSVAEADDLIMSELLQFIALR
jgi:hypothetical protein